MPEGPQVRRMGNLIEEYVGLEIHTITHPKSREWSLEVPNRIDSVTVKGKNIFIHFASGEIVYNHLLMWGWWRNNTTAQGKRLNTGFFFEGGKELGYYGTGIFRSISQEAEDLQLASLGPDILQASTPSEAFREVRKSTLPIGQAVLDQGLVSGIGNIYKSEGLFIGKVNPFQIACNVPEEAFTEMFEWMQPHMIHEVTNPGKTRTTPGTLSKTGLWNFVYMRWHQPCLACTTKIERVYQADRSTYWCPTCQAW